MKKINYFVFSISLFFVLIFSASAQELDFKSHKIDIDVDSYPYFFIGEGNGRSLIDYYVITCESDFYVNNQTSSSIYLSSNKVCKYTNYFTNGNKYASTFLSSSFEFKENMKYLSSFDLKNSNNEIIFSKNYIEPKKPFDFYTMISKLDFSVLIDNFIVVLTLIISIIISVFMIFKGYNWLRGVVYKG